MPSAIRLRGLSCPQLPLEDANQPPRARGTPDDNYYLSLDRTAWLVVEPNQMAWSPPSSCCCCGAAGLL